MIEFTSSHVLGEKTGLEDHTSGPPHQRDEESMRHEGGDKDDDIEIIEGQQNYSSTISRSSRSSTSSA